METVIAITTFIPDIITTIVAVSVGFIAWMLKRSMTTFSKNQSEQTKVLNNLRIENEVANTNYKNFQDHCKETTKTANNRLDSHGRDIKKINIKQGQHSITIADHGRRIGAIEQK